ncbi:hypothetical protein Hanom_Chr05g00396971 [Helianthus anomalus]
MRQISLFQGYLAFLQKVKKTESPFQSTKKAKILLTNEDKWMELTSRVKMARFQTFWIQMRKNKPLDESRKADQTSGTKMKFYSINYIK